MATFTGLGKSQNGGQSCKNFTNFYFSPVPPCKPTSMYPNSMVLIEKRLEIVKFLLKISKYQVEVAVSRVLVV